MLLQKKFISIYRFRSISSNFFSRLFLLLQLLVHLSLIYFAHLLKNKCPCKREYMELRNGNLHTFDTKSVTMFMWNSQLFDVSIHEHMIFTCGGSIVAFSYTMTHKMKSIYKHELQNGWSFLFEKAISIVTLSDPLGQHTFSWSHFIIWKDFSTIYFTFLLVHSI